MWEIFGNASILRTFFGIFSFIWLVVNFISLLCISISNLCNHLDTVSYKLNKVFEFIKIYSMFSTWNLLVLLTLAKTKILFFLNMPYIFHKNDIWIACMPLHLRSNIFRKKIFLCLITIIRSIIITISKLIFWIRNQDFLKLKHISKFIFLFIKESFCSFRSYVDVGCDLLE